MFSVAFDSTEILIHRLRFGEGLDAPARTTRPAGPTAADRDWWAAQTLGRAVEGFAIEGEPVLRGRALDRARVEMLERGFLPI